MLRVRKRSDHIAVEHDNPVNLGAVADSAHFELVRPVDRSTLQGFDQGPNVLKSAGGDRGWRGSGVGVWVDA